MVRSAAGNDRQCKIHSYQRRVRVRYRRSALCWRKRLTLNSSFVRLNIPDRAMGGSGIIGPCPSPRNMNWRCSQSTPTRFGGVSAVAAASAVAIIAASAAADLIGSAAAFKVVLILGDISIFVADVSEHFEMPGRPLPPKALPGPRPFFLITTQYLAPKKPRSKACMPSR
jgi:hypothetical protein